MEPGVDIFFKYEKLEGRNDIRLVLLPPGSIHSSVRCDLIHVDLSNAPDYEALSYTWADESGDNSLTGVVFCGPDDKRIPITRNCEAALRHLRLEHEHRCIWIDSICINQSTLGERNHQVTLMSRIYRSASRVVVYLGEAHDDSDKFFDYLNIAQCLDTQLSIRQLQSALKVFLRRWFTRLWVFQEITLAHGAVVMCGNKTTRWQNFADFHNKNFNQAAGSHKLPRFRTDRFTRAIFRYGLEGAQDIETFPQLFVDTHQGRASDSRDKVFALLGITERDCDVKLIPDYGASSIEVFTSLAVYFLRKFGIVFPTPEPPDRSTHDLSVWKNSWVFHWTQIRSPGRPIYIGDEFSLEESNDGVKNLKIRGQIVFNGYVTPLHGKHSLFHSPGSVIVVVNRKLRERKDEQLKAFLGEDKEECEWKDGELEAFLEDDGEEPRRFYGLGKMDFVGPRKKEKMEPVWHQIKKNERENRTLVKVSEDHCVLLREVLASGVYELISGTAALQEWKQHDSGRPSLSDYSDFKII